MFFVILFPVFLPLLDSYNLNEKFGDNAYHIRPRLYNYNKSNLKFYNEFKLKSWLEILPKTKKP